MLLLTEYADRPGGGFLVDALVVLAALWALTVWHAWFLVLIHGRSGRSPGKRLMKLQVVDAEGKPPVRGAMWRRSIPAIVEYIYVIALIGMLASPYRQRFGDRWAGTYVVDY